MIFELIDYWRQPSSALIRRLGYVYSTVALDRRYRRQRQNWAPHIQACHNFWQQILDTEKPQKLCIIGSGPLIETPIEQILAQVQTVTLVDVIHPRLIKRRWGSHPKIIWVQADVTGFSSQIGEIEKRGSIESFNFLPPTPPDFPPGTFDLIVSANVLSQLSLEPVKFLCRNLKINEDDHQVKTLIEKMGQDHLKFLRSFRCPFVVYSDIERIYKNPQGQELERHPSRIPDWFLGAQTLDKWLWQLCPVGEISKDFSIDMKVKGACFQSEKQAPKSI